jgi:hypothetical protein
VRDSSRWILNPRLGFKIPETESYSTNPRSTARANRGWDLISTAGADPTARRPPFPPRTRAGRRSGAPTAEDIAGDPDSRAQWHNQESERIYSMWRIWRTEGWVVTGFPSGGGVSPRCGASLRRCASSVDGFTLHRSPTPAIEQLHTFSGRHRTPESGHRGSTVTGGKFPPAAVEFVRQAAPGEGFGDGAGEHRCEGVTGVKRRRGRCESRGSGLPIWARCGWRPNGLVRVEHAAMPGTSVGGGADMRGPHVSEEAERARQ